MLWFLVNAVCNGTVVLLTTLLGLDVRCGKQDDSWQIMALQRLCCNTFGRKYRQQLVQPSLLQKLVFWGNDDLAQRNTLTRLDYEHNTLGLRTRRFVQRD